MGFCYFLLSATVLKCETSQGCLKHAMMYLEPLSFYLPHSKWPPLWLYRILCSIHCKDNKRNKVSSHKGQILGSLFRCVDQTWLNYLISLASMCGVPAACQLVGSWYKKDEWKDPRDGFITRSMHGDPILRCHSANVILKTLSAADSIRLSNI